MNHLHGKSAAAGRPWWELAISITTIILLALAMLTDTFAAATGKGTALHHPRWREAPRSGLSLGGLLLIGIGAAILREHLAAS